MVHCRETLTSLGPSFVKAGQVLASRPDIVREDYMNELCTLQDDVPSFPDDQVKFQHVPCYFQVGTTASIKIRQRQVFWLQAVVSAHSIQRPRLVIDDTKGSIVTAR